VKRAGVLSELGYTRRALDAFGEAIRRCDEDAAAEGARAGQQGAAGGSTGRSGGGGSDSDSGSGSGSGDSGSGLDGGGEQKKEQQPAGVSAAQAAQLRRRNRAHAAVAARARRRADALLHRGQLFLLEERLAAATADLDAALTLSGGGTVAAHLVLAAMGQYRRAISVGSPPHLARRHQASALALFRRASSQFPRSVEVPLFSAEVLNDLGDHQGALRDCARAAALSPCCPLPWLFAGRVYTSLNDAGRAQQHFARACTADPRCSGAALMSAQLLFAQGRTAPALAAFAEAKRFAVFVPEYEDACACEAAARAQVFAAAELDLALTPTIDCCE
jgi:tetratricopeptide (TPR) repeat protein